MRTSVLYLGLEESASQFQRAAKAAGMKPDDSIYAMFERVKVTSACAVQMINANLEEHKDIGLVVVDTLFKLARAKDTNSYTDSSDSLEPWHNLAMKHNIAILGLHHNRKAVSADAASSTNMSGSTAIAANATNIIEIYRQRANDASSQRIIRMNEYRFGDELQPLLLSFDKDTQRYTAAGALADWSAKETEKRLQEIEELIIDFVAQNPGREQKDIVQAVEARTSDVKAALYRLYKGESPVLKRTGEGVKSAPYLYFPADLMKEVAA
jgi:RecA-family ATPase